MAKPEYLATVTIVAKYESLPDKSDLVEVLDAIRNYGCVHSAIMEVKQPAQVDLVKEDY